MGPFGGGSPRFERRSLQPWHYSGDESLRFERRKPSAMVRAPMHQTPLPSATHAALGLLPFRVARFSEGVALLLLPSTRSRSVVDLRCGKADT